MNSVCVCVCVCVCVGAIVNRSSSENICSPELTFSKTDLLSFSLLMILTATVFPVEQ